jgi:hypothetical protein
MYYKVKIINVYKDKPLCAYSSAVSGEFQSLGKCILDILEFLESLDFELEITDLHYYIEVCGTDGPLLFKYLYLGSYADILESRYSMKVFDTEETLVEYAVPTKHPFEVET